MADPQISTSEQPDGFVLALSGGGLRATLYHLGVIRYMRDRGLLSQVTHITAVSGGSILAAHLVQHWREYTSSEDKDFEKASAELVHFAQRDVRGRVVRRFIASLVFPFLRLAWSRWSRTRLLEDEYARLYNNATLRTLSRSSLPTTTDETPSPVPPKLFLLATSLTNGALCYFSQDGGFGFSGEDASRNPPPSPGLPVAKAVAASSAFPPLFAPVAIDHDVLVCSQEEFRTPHYLTDGGIFDNLGVNCIRWLGKERHISFSRVWVSNAGAQPDTEVGDKFPWLVSRVSRSTDLLMKRLEEFELDANISECGTNARKLTVCNLHDSVDENVDASALPAEAQRLLRAIRTDLNQFSDLEIGSLVCQGYTSARSAAGAAILPNATPWTPSGTFPARTWDKAVETRLTKAASRSYGLWSWKDHVSYFNLVGALLWIALPLWAYFSLFGENKALKDSLTSAKTETFLAQWELSKNVAEYTTHLRKYSKYLGSIEYSNAVFSPLGWTGSDKYNRITWSTLVALQQLDGTFRASGNTSIKELLLWGPARDPESQAAVSKALATQFDGVLTDLRMAKYKAGTNGAVAVKLLTEVLLSPSRVVNDIARVVEEQYELVGE